MKLISIDNIKGTEVLARPILTSNYKELLSEGTKLKKDYIPKLKELGILNVYVKEEQADMVALAILKDEVNVICREKVQQIISKHTYHRTDDMIEIGKTADSIISNIMEEENVVEQIFDIKERSTDIYEHSITTCALATLIALKMRLPKNVVYNISVGCLLHDLGIRYMGFDFDHTDFTYISQADMEEYKKHPVYGYTAVKTEDWLSKESKDIILSHHERMDASGYPLHNSMLSIEIKIAGLCDFFDESICGIGCQQMKVYEVVEYLKSSKGKLFDEKIVDVLLEFVAVYPVGSKVMTNEGEIGLIIHQNKGFPERPTLKVITDKNGKEPEHLLIKDLLEYNHVFIEKVLN